MFDQLLADRQAQAGAAFLPGAGGVGLGKLLENSRLEVRRDALAMVAHADPQQLAMTLQAELHAGAGRRELAGVGEQVGQHLLQAPGIDPGAGQRVVAGLQAIADLILLGIGLVAAQRLLQQGQQGLGLQVEAHLAGEQFVYVQQIVDQQAQALAVVQGDPQQRCHALGHRAQGTAANQAQGAADRSQRGAQLVTDRGNEVAL